MPCAMMRGAAFRTDHREKVYPMVQAGTSNDDIILDPAHDTYGAR